MFSPGDAEPVGQSTALQQLEHQRREERGLQERGLIASGLSARSTRSALTARVTDKSSFINPW